MGYIDRHMIGGEQVVYRGNLHKIIFIKPVICLAVGIAVLLVPVFTALELYAAVTYLGLAVAGLGVLWAIWVWMDYATSEFGVTNKRVLIKSGLVRRKTLEMFLNKVEGIGVDQTVVGRIIGSGTLSITGSGGTKEEFKNISHPLDFRRQVHQQIAIEQDEKGDLGKDD